MPYIGLLQEGIQSLPAFLEKAQKNKFTVIAAPSNATEFPQEFRKAELIDKQAEFTYSDLVFSSEQWNSKVIMILPYEIDCDSVNAVVRKNSENVLKRDISWSEYLQYSGYTLLRLKSLHNVNLANVCTKGIKGLLLVQVPLYNGHVASALWRADIDESNFERLEQQPDSWNWWNNFRKSADYSSKIKLVLELNECEIPSDDEVCRWLGEPVEAVLIPSTLFIRNRGGFPVLPKAWQATLLHFVRSNLSIIVSSSTGDKNLEFYNQYLLHFRDTHKDAHSLQTYEDILEIPLQPLYDNLDCYTYEIFEKDPVKYRLYQNAVEALLIDRVPEEKKEDLTTVVMVLGAGRGPLVRSVFNAAANTKRKIRVYIIEKNPNAIRTLSAMAKKLWHNKDVHIFSKDMREFAPPEKADILVSELLGSFSDNELSPECLDCAQKLLKPDGVSIPCKSTSYINPIMSSKLFNAVRSVVRQEFFSRDKQATVDTHCESAFVVLMKNVYHISTPQPLFEFVHPNRDQPIDNSRYKVVRFNAKLDCVVTGIAGYFDCVLYKDIKLSIHPLTHSQGMLSWFPIFFPFSTPMDIKKGETIEIHFWRGASKEKIWYQWSLGPPHSTHIHNHGGRSFPIYCT